MRIFLAGFYEQNAHKWFDAETLKTACILGSYAYLNNRSFKKKYNPDEIRDFILDSGAFTYIHAAGNNVNWKEYARNYANFVKDLGIKRYVELDLDVFLGYDRVLQLRKMIEDIVGRPSIPVYHPNRTYEQLADDCKGHPYVAFGSKKDPMEYYVMMKKVVDIVHEQGSKIHLLGVSDPKHFLAKGIAGDSGDSTTWIQCSNFGYRCVLNRDTGMMDKIKIKHEDMILPSWKDKALSFTLWRQFSSYCARTVPTIWDEDADGKYPLCEDDSLDLAQLSEKYKHIVRRD